MNKLGTAIGGILLIGVLAAPIAFAQAGLDSSERHATAVPAELGSDDPTSTRGGPCDDVQDKPETTNINEHNLCRAILDP
jgi:hypothetical protein